MATNHTSNYQLNQWAATDQVLRTDFNADNAKVDSALKGLSTSIEQHSTQFSQISQQMAALGNCLLYQTSYTGTGSGTVTVTFPHKPILVFVTPSTDGCMFFATQGCGEAIVYMGSSSNGLDYFTWNGNTVSWINARSDPRYQCNENGYTYLVTALLDASN